MLTLYSVANTRPSHPSEPVRILQVIPIAMDDTPTAYLWNRSTEEHGKLLCNNAFRNKAELHRSAFDSRVQGRKLWRGNSEDCLRYAMSP